MFDHASMNRAYRLVWSDRLNAYVAAAETAKGRGQRAVRSVAATLLAALGTTGVLQAQTLVPPAPTQLPTGGKVVAGQAGITQNAARMDITQSSSRAAIDWQTFNVGSKAQVNFNQPSAQSVTLNRVLDAQPSQIYGRISANGQVYLTNPNGVYFSPTASADVGGLVATTHGISNTDFMAGKATFDRNGATGTVANQGNLNATLGGYIALLAPEVRNEGFIVAQAGTAVLAAGESMTLNFSGANTLAGVTVTSSHIKALVHNKHAVLAPGGLVILSAQAADRLQGGVVRNSGTVEALGMTRRGGRIVLEAFDRVENTGSVRADSAADGTAAGSISVSAPNIINAGTVSAAKTEVAETAAQPVPGGEIVMRASQSLVQTESGRTDVSGDRAGGITLKADYEMNLQGALVAASESGSGGTIALSAPAAVTLKAALDVSGAERAGSIQVRAAPGEPGLPGVPQAPSVVIVANGAQLRATSSRGRGGAVTLEGDYIRLAENSLIDASGAVGGGMVRVGGDWQGTGTLHQATLVTMEKGAIIDVSATSTGDGGKAVLWSDIRNTNGSTVFNGRILATGAGAGKGGQVETSGHALSVRGAATTGKGGQWLLDPYDVTIDNAASSNVDGSYNATGSPAIVDANAIAAALAAGGDVTVTTGAAGADQGNITLNSNIETGVMANDATLTLKAERGIVMNATTRIDASQNGNTSKLNVVLWSNVAGNGGGIVMGSNSALLSNGGNIVLGGGNDIATDYAVGTAAGLGGRGIWLKNGTVLNAAGGNITLRGQGKDGGEGVVLGDPGAIPGVAGSAQLLTTGGGNIRVTGQGTTASFGAATSGISLFNDVRIQTDSGAIDLTGSGGNTVNTNVDNSGLLVGPGSRVLSASGPITLAGNVGTGISTAGSGIRFLGGTNYLGHDGGTFLANSSGNVTVSADAFRSDGATTHINTTGAVTFQPLNASFSNSFDWSGNLNSGNWVGAGSVAGLVFNDFQNVGALTIGKIGNTADIVVSSALNFNGPVNLIGRNIQFNHDVTIGNGGMLTVIGSGQFTTADGRNITAQGGFNQDGNGSNSLGGNISTTNAPIRFAGAVTLRDAVEFNSNGGDITLDGPVTSSAPGQSARLTLNSGVGNITQNGEISNLHRLTLTSSGITTQTARMRVANLLLNGFGGDYYLTHDDNQIGTLAASVDTGSVVIKNGAPLTIGSVANVNGLVSTNGTIQIETAAGQSILVTQPISGPSPTLISGGDFTLGATVTATLSDLLITSDGTFTNTAGANALVTSGRWLVYSTTPYANTFGGLASGNTGLFGKTFPSYGPGNVAADGYQGNRYIFASTENITITTTSAGNTYGAAPLSLANNYSMSPLNTFGGAIVAPTLSGVPVISSAGSLITAHAGSYAITANVGGMSIDAPGYNIAAANQGLLTIAPRVVTLTGSRAYDATTNIAAGTLTLGNIVNGDTVTLAGSGFLSSKNVGAQSLSGVGSLSLSSGDYTLGGAATINITPAMLVISGVSAQNKIYDGSVNATLSGNAQVVPLSADVVSVGGIAVALFSDGNVGITKPVTVSGYALLGADAGNYSVQQPAGLSADIVEPPVAVIRAATPVLPPLPPTEVSSDLLERRPVANGGMLDISGVTRDDYDIPATTLARNAPVPIAGIVPVIVAEQASSGANEYSFPLPRSIRAMLDGAGSANVSVTQANRAPLPGWLRFDRWGGKFVAYAVPPNALPMEVMLNLGARSTVVRIAMPAPVQSVIARATVD